MENGLQVQVVGGGIAGLAAALACAQSGANVHLCEQAAAIKEVGAGLQMFASASRLRRSKRLGPVCKSLPMGWPCSAAWG